MQIMIESETIKEFIALGELHALVAYVEECIEIKEAEAEKFAEQYLKEEK